MRLHRAEIEASCRENFGELFNDRIPFLIFHFSPCPLKFQTFIPMDWIITVLLGLVLVLVPVIFLKQGAHRNRRACNIIITSNSNSHLLHTNDAPTCPTILEYFFLSKTTSTCTLCTPIQVPVFCLTTYFQVDCTTPYKHLLLVIYSTSQIHPKTAFLKYRWHSHLLYTQYNFRKFFLTTTIFYYSTFYCTSNSYHYYTKYLVSHVALLLLLPRIVWMCPTFCNDQQIISYVIVVYKYP